MRAPITWLCIATMSSIALTACGDVYNDEKTPEQKAKEKAERLFTRGSTGAIFDYAFGFQQLDAPAVCNSLTREGQQRLIRNFASTASDCNSVLRREFSLLDERKKRELAKGLEHAEVSGIRRDGRGVSGELGFEAGGEFRDVPIKLQKVRGEWKVSDPGDETLIPE